MDYKKPLMFLFAFMFLVSFASAFDWNDGRLVNYYNLSDPQPSTPGVTTVKDTLNTTDIFNNNALVNQTGIIGYGYNLTGYDSNLDFNNSKQPLSYYNSNFSIQFWVKPSLWETGDYLLWGATADVGVVGHNNTHIRFDIYNGSANHVYAEIPPLNSWAHIIVTRDTSGMKIYINGNLKDSNTLNPTANSGGASTTIIGMRNFQPTNNFNGTIDEIGFWNRSLTASEVTELYNSGAGLPYGGFGGTPTLTLQSPINAATISDVGTNFTVTGNNISSLAGTWKNLTYYVWNGSTLHNETTVQLDLNETFNNTLFIDDFTLGNYTWTALAYYNNSTGHYAVNTSNFTFSVIPFTVLETDYSPTTLEGSYEQFSTNISIISTERLSTVLFIYNGTSYPVTPIQYISEEWFLPYNLTIPQVTTNTVVPFYWSVRLESGLIYNTTSINQTIYDVSLDNCGVNSNQIFNLSMVDEDNQGFLSGSGQNTSIKIDMSLYSLADGQIVNYSAFYNQTNPARVCINQPVINSTLYMDAVIEYSSSGRFIEFYNIQKYILTNQTQSQNITLYNLNSSVGQEYQITYKGLDFVPVSDLIVQIQRKYIDEGVFKTIEIPMSGTNGYTIAHLISNDVIYNLIFIKDGEILDTFTDVIATCQNPSFTTCEINLNALVGSTDLFALVTEDDFFSSLSYDTTTRTISSTFGVISGVSGNVTLEVYLVDNFGTTEVCSDSLVAAGGTLSCAVPNGFGNATVYAKVLLNGEVRRDGFISMNPSPKERYAGVLIFMSIIMLLFIMGIAIQDNPMIMGIFLILGLLILVALNMVYSTSWIGPGATVLWFVVAVVMILIKGGNKR